MHLEENVPVRPGNLKVLSVILIGIFTFAVGGVGGYWVGSTRQQSSATTHQPSAMPIGLPSAPPVQSLSLTPTIAISHSHSLHSGQLGPNWKTYTNLEYDISFKYPSDARVTVETIYSMLSSQPSRGITVVPPYQEPYSKWYSFDLVVRDNPQSLDARTIIDAYIEDISKSCSAPACGTPQMISDTLKQYRNVDIDGYAFHIRAETDSLMVVQVKNGKTYIFRMTGDQGYVTNYGLEVFDRILSTFRSIPK